MTESEGWYVVKQANGQCAIASASEVLRTQETPDPTERWGPYATQPEAISRRVGLIRAGKCQPA